MRVGAGKIKLKLTVGRRFLRSNVHVFDLLSRLSEFLPAG